MDNKLHSVYTSPAKELQTLTAPIKHIVRTVYTMRTSVNSEPAGGRTPVHSLIFLHSFSSHNVLNLLSCPPDPSKVLR